MGKKIYIVKRLDEYEPMFYEFRTKLKTFTTTQTTYTKSIEVDGYKYLYNEDGKFNYPLLALIAKVRKDAARYMEKIGVVNDEPIDFFKLIEIPDNAIGFKIDLTSAYWTFARKKTIVSKDTDAFLLTAKTIDEESNKPRLLNAKERKSLRLKALGSLATKKYVKHYVLGDLHTEDEPIVCEYKEVYKFIQSGIDLLFQEISTKFRIYFYYVDCLFAPENQKTKILKYLHERGYTETNGLKTKLSLQTIGNTNYLFSEAEDKLYFTRPEDVVNSWLKQTGNKNVHLIQGNLYTEK